MNEEHEDSYIKELGCIYTDPETTIEEKLKIAQEIREYHRMDYIYRSRKINEEILKREIRIMILISISIFLVIILVSVLAVSTI